jgi:DNA-binding NtrC family response regulator
LADDEETVRIVGSRMLRKQGYHTVTVHDGQEAVESIASDPSRYCAAILDVTMPRKDGLAAYREMHKLAPQLPIIMASGYNRDQIMEKFDQEAPPPFLHKPFRISELSRVLKDALKQACPAAEKNAGASQTAEAPLE